MSNKIHEHVRLKINFTLKIFLLLICDIRPVAPMLPSASSGLGFAAVNAFHLNAGQNPPPLQPDAVYTYQELENFHQVETDINRNLCIPSRIHTWAIWIEPSPPAEEAENDDMDHSPEDDASAHDSGPPEGAGEVTSTPADATAAGTHTEEATSAVPPHPSAALFDLALTRHTLPLPQQRQFQDELALAIAKATEVHMLTGLPADEALNEARSAAWTFIREMRPIDVQRAKRQRFLPHNAEEAGRPGASSSGWY